LILNCNIWKLDFLKSFGFYFNSFLIWILNAYFGKFSFFFKRFFFIFCVLFIRALFIIINDEKTQIIMR
jgi:hypothetical protein